VGDWRIKTFNGSAKDEITAAENAFMQGREMKPKNIKKTKLATRQYQLNLQKTTTQKANGKELVSCEL